MPSGVMRARAPKLADKLVVYYSDRIKSGSLPAGSKLPTENEITRQHQVSRAVVREALSQLQAAGLVQSRQGLGTFVLETAPSSTFTIDRATVLTMRDTLALLEFRISFETEACYLAAFRHTPEQLARMRGCIETIAQLLEKGNETKRADFEFHRSIAAATGNRYFSDLLGHLGLAILPRARVDLRYIAPTDAAEYLQRSNREHMDIYQAIARRDGEGARAAMRTHLSNSRERLRQLSEAAAPDEGDKSAPASQADF